MTGRRTSPVRVAVIGAGWAARSIWLPRLTAHPAFTVAAVVDPDPGARAAASAGVNGDVRRGTGGDTSEGAPPTYASVAELPAGAVDLAVVAVPNHLHASVAETVLRAGVPAFVEKPVCLTSAEADRLAAAEAAGGAVLLAGSAARFRADVRTLLELADDVGDVRHVSAGWVRARGIPDGAGWFTSRRLSGGGALVDLGWHLLDVVAPLLPPGRFRHVVGSLSDDFINDPGLRAGWRRDGTAGTFGDVEDTARGFLVTEEGVSVSLTAGWASHQPSDVTTVVVEGSTGTLALTCTFGFSPDRRGGPVLTLTRRGEVQAVPVAEEPVGAEYDRLLDDLATRWSDPAARGAAIREARRTVDSIERLYASAAPARRPAAPLPTSPLPTSPLPTSPLPASPLPASPLRAVVFDLDGVLVDSFGVMRQAFTYAYREAVGAGEPPFAEYNRHLGRYFPDIMRIMGLPLEMEEPFVRESTRLADQVTLFPGVEELLRQLRDQGIGTAVATGKAGWRARHLLERLGVIGLFDHVIGSDEVPRAKPAPDIVLRALRLLDVGPQEAVMVGDAVTDLAAARGAGVPAIAALWGETDEGALLAADPDFAARKPAELAEFCLPAAAGTALR
ncbi:HAD-IA family hydrolase [Streptomyces sp. NBC_01275]|uniref:HAD-IA family hydrolase n=1 Tax=Streptomyces sp. NBC_01275 TaxID=2903807 RepID=UPI002B1DF728|nr:HAD-IA family hydrolase [Streptomyces sp. NBC_01275]